MATGGRKNEPNTCRVCLGSYRNPKLLPCAHVFCVACIQDIAARCSGGQFLFCPSCFTKTSLPSGGATALQTYFYTQPGDPEPQRPHVEDMRETHKKELEFFCVKCTEALCIDCKIAAHLQHETDDLASAVSSVGNKLLAEKGNTLDDLSGSLHEAKVLLREQCRVLEELAEQEHARTIAAANAIRDRAKEALAAAHAAKRKEIEKEMKRQRDNKAELTGLIQLVEDAISSGNPVAIINASREMTTGRGSEAAIKAMLSQAP
ncbi:hypothetical protein ACOMHN_059509 [Nucella lapillus]